MASTIESIMNVVLPRRMKPKGTAETNTFDPSRTDQVLAKPDYQEHKRDLFNDRLADSNQDLLQKLFIQDPDVSATVNAFLTVADTLPIFYAVDQQGNFDREGTKTVNQLLDVITTRYDYSKGFLMKPSIRTICENLRYMLLLRGGIASELVFDKGNVPSEIRIVDLKTLEWFEKEPNRFVPQQRAPASNAEINLDIPTFFVNFFRRDPTSIYTYSPFVSSINTVAARQQVINDLYRIMQVTGYPRIEVEVVEEILLKNAPADVQSDGAKQRQYISTEIARIQQVLSATRADQPLIHTDSIKMRMFNDKAPTNALNIDSIIGALNAMNQAGLRTVATVLGRGESGVNTASVEARIFSMNAEAINVPIADLLADVMTTALRVTQGTDSHVICRFRPVELRPLTELEPQLTMRSSRLKEDLSLGIISDDEYHLEMYGRIRPDEAPELSGTNFLQQKSLDFNHEEISPNQDALGRGLAPKKSKAARSDSVKKQN